MREVTGGEEGSDRIEDPGASAAFPGNVPAGWPHRTWRDHLATVVAGPEILRPVFWILRKFAPILKFRNTVVVSRHADVVDVLSRDEDFTLAEVNGERMARWSGAFILGSDRGEDFDRENGALRRAARDTDVPRIRALVADNAAQLLDGVPSESERSGGETRVGVPSESERSGGETRAGARGSGQIDVVGGYARVVAARVVAQYFGTPGPDEATTMRWMRALFDVVFIDEGPRARQAASITIAEQKPYMEALIATRRAEVEAGEPVPDDVLTRLVAMGANEPWLDDDAVRRNVNGLIVGALDTTSKAVAHVVDELLRHPDALAGARDAAVAGNIDTVRDYAWEALRFRPHGPVLERHCKNDTTLGRRRVPAGSVVLVSVLSAMFDKTAFPEPGRLAAGRPLDRYLHFGHGMHTCFGLYINDVQIPELVAGLVRLPGLRRAPGGAGRLVYDGPFPERLVVAFDKDVCG